MCHIPHCNNYTPQGEFYCPLHSEELMPAGDIPYFMKEEIYAKKQLPVSHSKKTRTHKRVSGVPRKKKISITKKSYSVRPSDQTDFTKTPFIVKAISAVFAVILLAILVILMTPVYLLNEFLKKD